MRPLEKFEIFLKSWPPQGPHLPRLKTNIIETIPVESTVSTGIGICNIRFQTFKR